jgi:hypothetical protein
VSARLGCEHFAAAPRDRPRGQACERLPNFSRGDIVWRKEHFMATGRHFAAVLIVAAAVGASAGCWNKEMTRQAAGVSASQFQSDLNGAVPLIDGIRDALSALHNPATADRDAALASLNANASKLRTLGRQLGAESDAAGRDVRLYFQKWVQESRTITEPAAREQAVQRIDANRQHAREAARLLDEGAAEYRQFDVMVQKFEKAFAKDNSMATAATTQKQLTSVLTAGEALKATITQLNSRIEKALLKP